MSQKGNVDFCPVTKEMWEERTKAKSGDCGGQSVYHCLSDNEGGKWERCVEKSRIKEGFCAIFSNKGFIDWKPCNISVPTCPNISYVSDEIYNYPRCFGNNSIHKQIDVNNNNSNDSNVAEVVGVVIGLVILSAAVLTFGFLYVRRKRMNLKTKDEHEESQKLLPGRMSDEIVMERNVVSGIALLSKNEVRSIVVVGKFGNSVTSTCRRILINFKNTMNWNSLECRYTDIPDTIGEDTIVYVHGWFGLWNDDLCSVDKAKTACQALIRILNGKKNVKLILGMRSDFDRKYHSELDNEVDHQDMSLVHYEIKLDSSYDMRKDPEYSRYLNNQIKKSCEKSDCACIRLKYEMLQKAKDRFVGMPLKLSLIKMYHDLIPSYLDHCDILKVMIDHFIAIEKDKERRYVHEWIVYICLKGKFSRSDPFDTALVTEMSLEIKKSSFDENDSELCKYIRMRNSDKQKHVSPENSQYVFWHPFIYICAFHFLFHKDPELVIKHCIIDAILQLVRPKEYAISYFEVAADDRCVTLFNERIHELGREEEYAEHPLVKTDTRTEEAEPSQIQLSVIKNITAVRKS